MHFSLYIYYKIQGLCVSPSQPCIIESNLRNSLSCLYIGRMDENELENH